MPILKDLLKNKDSKPISKDKIKEACEGKISPAAIEEGLEKLADLGIIAEDINPKTNEKEYSLEDAAKDDGEVP